MLRISTTTESPSAVTLKVEGDLVGDWVPLLEAECLRRVNAGKRVELDFIAVGYIDRVGIAMVHGLSVRGVRVASANALVLALLGRSRTP